MVYRLFLEIYCLIVGSFVICWNLFLARWGYSSSQFCLGNIFLEGAFVAQNDVVAREWYELAAERGHIGAQIKLGYMYRKGLGGKQDYEEAIKWYKKAADKKDSCAQYNLGVMCEKGESSAKNYKKAVRLYTLSAEQGNLDAQHSLGEMFYFGIGVEQDKDKAKKMFLEAAAQAHRGSHYILKCMDEIREEGVHDDVFAYVWFIMTGTFGNEEASERKNVIAGRMNTVQLEEANKMFLEICGEKG